MDIRLTSKKVRCMLIETAGADPGFFKGGGGSIIGLQAKKGGPGGGSNFRSNVNKP